MVTIGSDSLGAAGSAGDSPRPIFDTTLATPGIAATNFIASISISIDSSNEIEGTRIITGVSAPSFSVGIKDLPKKGNNAKDVPNKATATMMVIFSLASA